MTDGDNLNFETGDYYDQSLIINKSINVNGNGANLHGYASTGQNNSNVPEVVRNTTANGGYATSNLATMYVFNSNNTIISSLNFITLDNNYNTTAILAKNALNLTIINCTVENGSWGIYTQYCENATIKDNTLTDQTNTGIIAFGSAYTQILNNTVIDAANHGIDVRHGTGPKVTIKGNTIIHAAEGIYLMHSAGHIATENTIINCTISSITCYGSGNINIYNNTFKNSRIGVLLGSGFYNVTVGKNNFNLNSTAFPPTFPYYVAIANAENYGASYAEGVYSDITTPELIASVSDNTFIGKLVDSKNNPIENKTISVIMYNAFYTIEREVNTDENGTFSVETDIQANNIYLIKAMFEGDEDYNAAIFSLNIGQNITENTTFIDSEIFFATPKSGENYTIILVDNKSKALVGEEIAINLTNSLGQSVIYWATTNTEGIAKLPINLAWPGVYNITASYAGKEGQDSCVGYGNITILDPNNISNNLTASEFTVPTSSGKNFTAKLTDKEGNVLAGHEVSFTLSNALGDSKTYWATTNTEGIAKLPINLAYPNTYGMIISFGGDSTIGAANTVNTQIIVTNPIATYNASELETLI